MNRLHRVAVGCAAAVALLGGCTSGTPSATSAAGGSPSPAVAASPAPPKKYVTEIGACLKIPIGSEQMVRNADIVVACDKGHNAQVVGAGEFGADGATDAAMAAAYAKCDKAARAYLKEDWRNGRLEIKVERPESATAAGGERWWECIVKPAVYFELDVSFAQGIPAALRHGCQQTVGSGQDISLSGVDCATAHQAEYAGAVVMPAKTPFPKTTKQWDAIHAACRKVVGAFVGVRADQVRRWYSQTMRDEEAWPGLRDVRCYVYFAPKTMTRSAKGTKGKGVPW